MLLTKITKSSSISVWETVAKWYASERMSQIKVIAENYRKVASVVVEWFQKE